MFNACCRSATTLVEIGSLSCYFGSWRHPRKQWSCTWGYETGVGRKTLSRYTSDLLFQWVTRSGFLISCFLRVLYVVCFLLGNSPASGVYMPTFRNTLFHLHRQVWRWTRQSVPKRRHINFRRRGITQKKAYKVRIDFYPGRSIQCKVRAYQIHNSLF